MLVLRLSILTGLLFLFAGPSSALFLEAGRGDHVVTTDRLNLRGCPGTTGCAVLRTLPRGTHLDINARQGDWLHVTSPESKAAGWVHGDYTQVVEHTSSRRLPFSSFISRDLLMKFFVPLFIFGALLTMASVGRNLRENATQGQLFALSALSVLTGAFFLLNQFGPAMAALAEPWLSLKEVSFLWEINSVTKDISYSKLLLFLGVIVTGIAAIAPGANGGRLSFLQGVCTGFLTLPLLTIIAFLTALVLYLLSFVFKALFYVLGLIAIPLIWLYEHLVAPVLRWLAIPFIWLWENILREIILFLAPPFVWLWEVLIQPLTELLLKFILKPIAFLIAGVLVALVGLFPFAVIGAVALESVRNSVRGSLSASGLFAQGVTAGFLLLDALLLASLSSLEVLRAAPPLSLVIPVTLLVVVILRLVVSSERKSVEETSPVFQQRLTTYWSSSQLEMISSCVVIPLSVVASLVGDGDS